MKKEIFKDHQAINQQLKDLKQKVSYIQNFVNEYNQLGFDKLKGEELVPLFASTKEFISKKLTGGDKLKIGSFTANPEKLLEIADKPKGLDNLLLSLEKHNTSRTSLGFYQIELYSIEEDKVVVSSETISSIEEKNTVYLENEIQKNVYMAINAITENLNNLKHLLGGRLTLKQIDEDCIKRATLKKGIPSVAHADFTLNTKIIKKLK